jgi:hypothetical protein
MRQGILVAARDAGTQNAHRYPLGPVPISPAATNRPAAAPRPIATLIMPWYMPRSLKPYRPNKHTVLESGMKESIGC